MCNRPKTMTQASRRSTSVGRHAATTPTRARPTPRACSIGKAPGKEAKRGFGGHIRRENRNSLCADFPIHDPIAEPEPVGALRQAQAHPQLHEGVRVKP